MAFWDNTSFWGDVIGGGLSWLGGRETSQNALEGAQYQADAIREAGQAALDAAQPWGVGGLGGTADFDSDSRTALMSMSPELSDMYQGALTRSGLWGAQAAQYSADPFAAADTFYQQQQPYYQQEEDRARTALETRLLAQGRLGGTGGGTEQQALEEAIGRGQDQRRTKSFSQAQSLINTLLGRESGDIGTATGLLDIPLQYGKLGRGIGGDLGGVAKAGLASRADAAKTLGSTFASSQNSRGTGLDALGGLFSKHMGTQA